MPTMTSATALALILDYRPQLWDDSDFQTRFHFPHSPLSRTLDSAIPLGIKSSSDFAHLATLFESLKNVIGVQGKRAILESKDGRAGLVVWKKWVTYHWVPKVNAIVERALVEEGHHPKDIIADEHLKEFPAGSNSIHVAAAAIASALFGDGFLTISGNVPIAMTDVVVGIGIQNWNRIRKQYKRVDSKYPKAKAEFESVMELLKKDKISPSESKRALKALVDFKNFVTWYPHDADVFGPDIERASDILKSENHRHRKVQMESIKKGQRNKKSKNNELDLATFSDVTDVWVLFEQHFANDFEDDSIDLNRAAPLETDLLFGHVDLGVSRFQKYTDVHLDYILGLVCGRPVLFNSTRWDDPAVNFWDVPNDQTSTNSLPLQLLWHQKVGVAAMVHHYWSSKPHNDQTGMILADEVGVGKTAQIMAFIAFVIEQRSFGLEGRSGTTPIIRNQTCFGGLQDGVPNSAHLIIVPGTLIGQWYREMKVFFKKRSIDIFKYPSSWKDMMRFWDSDSAFNKSEHDPIHRVILMTHAALLTQVGKIFDCSPAGAKGLAKSEVRRIKRGGETVISNTVFSQKWATLILDEAHEFRTAGKGLYGMISLRNNASAWILATATPLYTSPRDLLTLLRILNIPEVIGEAGDIFEREHNRQIQIEKRKITPEEKAEGFAMRQGMFLGKEFDDLQDPNRRVRFCLLTDVISLKQFSDGCVIRRTLDSVKYDGTLINQHLPPYKTIVIGCRLSQQELEGLNITVGEILQSRMDGFLDFQSEKFYIPYRTAIAYPKTKGQPYPVFSNLADWQENNQGSKLAVLIKMLLYLLSDDRADDIIFDGERIVYPPLPKSNGLPRPQKRKCLVYHEFPMMADTIISALAVNGISARVLNGSVDTKKRDLEVKEFINNPAERILLLSRVASVGLNLTRADIVIFYDISWSEVLTKQVVGRAWRLGQEKQVKVYHMVALQTTDVVMSSFARLKSEMLEAFVSSDENNRLISALKGEFEDGFEDDESEGEIAEELQPRRRPKKKIRPEPKTGNDDKVSTDVESETNTRSGSSFATTSRSASSMDHYINDDNGENDSIIRVADDFAHIEVACSASSEKCKGKAQERHSSSSSDFDSLRPPHAYYRQRNTDISANNDGDSTEPALLKGIPSQRKVALGTNQTGHSAMKPVPRTSTTTPNFDSISTNESSTIFGTLSDNMSTDEEHEVAGEVEFNDEEDFSRSQMVAGPSKRPAPSPPRGSNRRPPKRFTTKATKRRAEGGYESDSPIEVIVPKRMPGSSVLGLPERRKAVIEKYGSSSKRRPGF